jgi:uncharacterized protein (DUF2141 family)
MEAHMKWMMAVAALGLAAGAAAQGGASGIDLRIDGIRSAAGTIEIDVIAPGRRKVLERRVPARPGSVSVPLPLEAGAYAVILYHDENGNNKLDRGGMLGMPTEGYAFSNDAPVRFGPPSFEAMRIEVKPGSRTPAAVRMRYP